MIYELILTGVSFFHPQAQDSLGVETVNGKIFVIHKVEEKETLYGISRRYGATVDAVIASNPGLGSTLEIGQILKVPYTRQPKVSTPHVAGGTVHKVEPKETMYSISKKYGVTVEEIKQWNGLSDNTLSIGQELIVKKPKPAVAVASRSDETTHKKGSHTVAQQETLFSVARQYGVSVQQLKTWNALATNDLKVGQVIVVAPPEQQKESTGPVGGQQTEVRKDPPVEERQVQPVEETPVIVAQTDTTPTEEEPASTASQVQPETSAQASVPTTTQTVRISESLKNSDEVMESGLAELIEGTEGNRKYLALHRTAPVGTILKVRNEMNNREVFVRVMGKLPDTAVNNKLIIKLSRSAYDRLGAIDPKFRVEVTYYK